MCMQLQEGDLVKGLVQDLLRQFGSAGGPSMQQAILKFGMQGARMPLALVTYARAHAAAAPDAAFLRVWIAEWPVCTVPDACR